MSAQVDLDSITYSISLDDFVVTAQYEPTHYKEAIHKIGIINREKIDKIGAVTLEQALVLSPSVRLYEDPILGTSIRMRGVSSSNVSILIDGVPVIGRNDGAIDLSQISLQNIERIEIVEGPLSNIYGSNAAGGVVNLITKKSQLNKWSLLQTNQLESIGQRNHVASIGYQRGGVNVGVHGRYFDYNQYISDSLRITDRDILDDGSVITTTRYPFNPKTQKSIGGYLRYSIDEDHYLLAKYDYNNEAAVDYGVVKRLQFNPYATDQYYQTKRKDFSLSYKGKFHDKMFVNILSSSNQYDRIRDDQRYYLESMKFDSLLHSSDSVVFEQLYTRVDVGYTGWDDWVVSGGVSYTSEFGSGDRIINYEDNDSSEARFSESAIYMDLKYKGIKNIQFSMGNRLVFHSVYDRTNTISFNKKYNINDKVSWRSSLAQGYRNPSLKELYLEFIDINHNIIGNTELEPERSYDIQTTLSYALSKSLDLSINAYYTSIYNQIALTEYETLKYQYNNVDQYKVYGLQPSFSLSNDVFNINSNLSIGYWSTNIDEDDIPNYGQVLDVNNTVGYRIPIIGTNILVNHRYVGAQPTYRLVGENIEVGNIESYHLIDCSLSKSVWKKRVEIISGIRNLANTTSINALDSTGGTHSGSGKQIVSSGRSVFISLSLRIE